MIDALPADVLCHLLSFVRAADVLIVAPTCQAFAGARDDESLWESIVSAAVHRAVRGASFSPRHIDADVARVEATLRARADALCPRAVTLRAWVRLKILASTVCAACAARSQERCLISLHGRIFDVTPFLEGDPYDHPGGVGSLVEHHGKDCWEAFEAFGHSQTAHKLMRDRFMVFDGGAHLGSLMWPKLLGHRARIRRGSIQRLGGPSAKPESWPQLAALAVLAAVGGVAAHYYAPLAIAGVS